VNLELEHLEKGELLVKISSGTSSRGSNCDDVDELSDVVQSDVLSQNLNTNVPYFKNVAKNYKELAKQCE
jgi:hypothetical protein